MEDFVVYLRIYSKTLPIGEKYYKYTKNELSKLINKKCFELDENRRLKSKPKGSVIIIERNVTNIIKEEE